MSSRLILVPNRNRFGHDSLELKENFASSSANQLVVYSLFILCSFAEQRAHSKLVRR